LVPPRSDRSPGADRGEADSPSGSFLLSDFPDLDGTPDGGGVGLEGDEADAVAEATGGVDGVTWARDGTGNTKVSAFS
jgi:hypothetical protein